MPVVPTLSPPADALEPAVLALGRDLAGRMPGVRRAPARAAERRLMAALSARPDLRAALFRFVDVRPACTTPADLTRHLAELLDEAGAGPPARAVGTLAGHRAGRAGLARTASIAVDQMAHRFIVGADPAAALPAIEALWADGVATSVDLLGEATVTEAEAQRYAERCEEALRTLSRAARDWPARPALEADASGPLARVNLSVKVSALTPLLRPEAPERGIEDAAPRLRHLLRVARDLGAHLHIDTESFDSREAVTGLALGLLAEDEFRDGPSAGVVLQAYLAEGDDHLDELLAWAHAHPRAAPLGIRLVKGAYWDHEVVQAAQHGWAPPVHTDKRACDRAFEALTRRLIDATGVVRPAIASHNLRSLAHAMAYADAAGLAPRDLELQVLRGLGDETQVALASAGRRVRTYCPVGDLVAGMAYLVRRLLENTANDSFLGAHAGGEDLDTLLEAP
jgi:RHH-type proline utilization regulon transcriptional repressor/proline dehydrogenase/delta 1-pyrroline-5-carboxylate dehydrogenase